MSKKSKVINILAGIIIVLIVSVVLGQRIYAVNADYNFDDVTKSKGILLANENKPTALLGKVFNNSLELSKSPARNFLLCVEEYNRNLTRGNHYWKSARVMDFNMKSSDYTDPTYAIGYASGTNKKSASKPLYAKLAAYAYWQNTKGIDAYSANYSTTLKNLINELKKSGNNSILVGYGNSAKGTAGLEGVSKTINKEFSTALTNYANFANAYTNTKGKLFDYEESKSLKYENNLLGPYDLNLANGAAQKTVNVNHTSSSISGTSAKATTNITTGVQVTKVTITLTDGKTINVTNDSKAKLKRKNADGKYVDINFDTFDWKSSFYISQSGIDASKIKSVKLYYKYDLYYARYVMMSGKYGDNKYSTQGYMAFQGKKKTISESLTLGVPKVNPKQGIIKLTKVDENDNSKKIEGVKFQVLRSTGVGKTVLEKTITTDSNGYATCKVPLGYTYYIKEVKGTNTEYDYSKLKVKSSNIKDAATMINAILDNSKNYERVIKITGFNKKLTKDTTLTLVATNPVKNEEKISLEAQIKKVCSETGKGIEGVKFDLYRTKSHDGQESKVGTAISDVNGNVNFGKLDKTYTYTVSEQRKRTESYDVQKDTNGDGVKETVTENRVVTEWVNVEHTGNYTYKAVEVGTNERYIFESKNVTLSDGSTKVTNTPKKQTIKGKVFEDIKLGKESKYDGILSSADKALEGIVVTLRDKNDASFTRTTQTNSSGEYTFNNLSQFREYYVEFIYNGQEYMATEYKVGGSSYYGTNSLAKEIEEERTNFNAKFETISSTTNENTEMKAYTSDDMYLNYENKNALGNLIQVTDNEIIISGVNLGLVQRQKADLALEKDVYSATLKIKDYEQTYMYNTRRLDSDFSAWDIQDRLNVEDYYSKVYNREIYSSDYEYKSEWYKNRGVSINTDTELKVYVTYIVKVKNSSQSIVGKINEIVDYYDTDYSYVPEMSYINVNNSKEDLTANENSSYGTNKSMSGFKNLYINGLDKYDLIAGDYLNLYVTFEVNKNDNKIILDQDLNTMKISTGKENLAEINAFSTYYGENTILPNIEGDQQGKVAGLFDVDSTPGNLNDSNKYDKSSYEDDTAVAPNITITLSTNVRQISGYVWEDERNLYNDTYKTNIGNGIRDNGEKLIDGVTAQLIEKIDGKEIEIKSFKTGSTADLSAIFGIKIDGKDYITINKNEVSKGKYIFKSLVPGDYYIKFAYGDSADTALTTKATWCGNDVKGLNDKSYNGIDFKSTIYQTANASADKNNDAKDVWARRGEVSEFAKVMLNSKAEALNIFKADVYGDANNNEKLLNEMIEKTKMYANSVDFKVEVETSNVDNIDLGLTERPKTQLVLNKTVENVKLVLSDGTILYDAKDKMSHVLWNSAVEGHKVQTKKGLISALDLRNKKGLIQLTVDEEYMKGATVVITYKITVTNNSEADYNEEQFYYTGTVGNMNNIVKTSATKVIDYVENDLGFNEELNKGWKAVEKTEGMSNLIQSGHVSGKLQDVVNSYNTIIMTEDLNKQLAPGESVSKELVLSKTLGASQESTSFNNMAEIVEISNSVGRVSVDTMPGDQNPTTDPTQVDAEDSETVTLLTPFGAAKIAAQKAMIAVAGLAIVATGIVLIRKKVVKSKKQI